MNYIFGNKGEIEVLKTKGDSHTNLTGYHSIEQIYPDQTITDNFHVVRKIDSKEDIEGNCYDWYEIDRHYRTQDKATPLIEKINANIDYISMMADIELPEVEPDGTQPEV